MQDLEISATPHVMVAATYGRGAWKVTLSGSNNQAPVAGFNSTANLLTVNFTSTKYRCGWHDRFVRFGILVIPLRALRRTQAKPNAAAGTDVALTVTDDKGATNTITKAVTVVAANQPPVAQLYKHHFWLNRDFTDTSTDSDGTIASRSWNFGDSTTSTATNPIKTYTTRHNMTLTVTG